MKKRSVFWDNYKGVLILLVVFGHYIYSYANKIDGSFAQDIYQFIYTFHMPAFVFCSGYFSKSEHSVSINAQLKLFLYYAVFNTFMLVFAYFYLDSSISLLTPYYSYWYILSLIIWRAIVGKLDNVKGITILSLLVTLALGFSSSFSNMLSIRRTIAFFVFFVAGYLLDKEKTEKFINNRKPWQMFFGVGITVIIVAVAYWAVEYFGITASMGMMSAYKNPSDVLRRLIIIIIAVASITCMMLTIPNRKIPFLSKMGKNSLLIYLGHRFFTIIYYTDILDYKNYSNKYLIYAFFATVITCVVLSSDKLNIAIAKAFNKATCAVLDKKSKTGVIIKTVLVVMFLVLLCANGLLIF